jgi:protein-arginine kinase activator protein McsA
MLTDKEINKIAKLVAKEVVETFVREYATEMKVEPIDETDLIVLELDRLNNLMSRYVSDEQYEKATIIKRKIEILKNRYDLN